MSGATMRSRMRNVAEYYERQIEEISPAELNDWDPLDPDGIAKAHARQDQAARAQRQAQAAEQEADWWSAQSRESHDATDAIHKRKVIDPHE